MKREITSPEVSRQTDDDKLYHQAKSVIKRHSPSWNANSPEMRTAFNSLQRLADQNYGNAYWPLSNLYSGNNDIEERQARAKHYELMAFVWCFSNQFNRDVNVWRDLGLMYLEGSVVDHNSVKAAFWFHKAAEQGDIEAQCALGLMYIFGKNDVQQDCEEGIKWYRLAAEQGDVDAQVTLGDIYSNGFDVHRNFAEARRWYLKAAALNDSYAQFALGEMYRLGQGIPHDMNLALRWHRMAAENGCAQSQFEAGLIYARGAGVTADIGEATRFLRMAVSQVASSSKIYLDAMRELEYLNCLGDLMRAENERDEFIKAHEEELNASAKSES